MSAALRGLVLPGAAVAAGAPWMTSAGDAVSAVTDGGETSATGSVGGATERTEPL